MKTSTKIWIIIAAVLVAAGITLFVIIMAPGNWNFKGIWTAEFVSTTIDVEEDFPVWKEYAVKKGIHAAVISYLDIKKENFYRIENTPEGLQFVTARGWEDLSRRRSTPACANAHTSCGSSHSYRSLRSSPGSSPGRTPPRVMERPLLS